MDDEKLIEFVRNCPCLYDKSHKEFKNPERKRRAWLEVANNLEVDESVVIKRWGNLRERFSKEIRISSSGSGASVGRQWALLDSLQFLRSHIIPRPMRQSAPSLEINDASGEILEILCETPSLAQSPQIFPAQSPPRSTPIPSAQSTPIASGRTRKRRAAQVDELDTAILDTVKTFQEVCARKASREEFSAEISGFGKMICSAISKMKKPSQALVMRRCTDIVMQAQIDEHEEVLEEQDY